MSEFVDDVFCFRVFDHSNLDVYLLAQHEQRLRHNRQFADASALKVRSVFSVEVCDFDAVRIDANLKMVPRNKRIIDRDLVVGVSPNPDNTFLRFASTRTASKSQTSTPKTERTFKAPASANSRSSLRRCSCWASK